MCDNGYDASPLHIMSQYSRYCYKAKYNTILETHGNKNIKYYVYGKYSTRVLGKK